MTAKEIYDKYLLSQHWFDLRESAFNKANRRCETCKGKPRHGHHLIYRTPLESCTAEDIMALCERCHNIWHDWLKQMGLKVTDFCRQSTRGGILALLNPVASTGAPPARKVSSSKSRKVYLKPEPKPAKKGSNAKEVFMLSQELTHAIDTMRRDVFKAWLRENVPGKKRCKIISQAFMRYDKARGTHRSNEAVIINGVYHA